MRTPAGDDTPGTTAGCDDRYDYHHVLVGILVALTYAAFRKDNAIQQLRYGATQAASGLREAEGRPKPERTIDTIAFTAWS